MPSEFRRVYDVFKYLSVRRKDGIHPIDTLHLHAYLSITQIELTAIEILCLNTLDAAFVNATMDLQKQLQGANT